jgi:hypothetical protein
MLDLHKTSSTTRVERYNLFETRLYLNESFGSLYTSSALKFIYCKHKSEVAKRIALQTL